MILSVLACGDEPQGSAEPEPSPKPRLTISAIAPSVGSTGGGAPVRIAGTGIQRGAVVTFDVTRVSSQFVHGYAIDRQIGTETPPHTPGPVDVTVSNPDGQTVVLARAYTYVPPASLDFEGQWVGLATGDQLPWHDGGAADVRLVIRGGHVVSISCNEMTATLAPPSAVGNGQFAHAALDGTAVTGRIVSEFHAIGTMTFGLCRDVLWTAERRASTVTGP